MRLNFCWDSKVECGSLIGESLSHVYFAILSLGESGCGSERVWSSFYGLCVAKKAKRLRGWIERLNSPLIGRRPLQSKRQTFVVTWATPSPIGRNRLDRQERSTTSPDPSKAKDSKYNIYPTLVKHPLIYETSRCFFPTDNVNFFWKIFASTAV